MNATRTRLSLTLAALAALAVIAPAPAGAATARPADSFVESVGVNVHLSYSDTEYAEFDRVRAALGTLGVRYIRDGVGLNRSSVYSRFRTLGADGIKVNVIVGDPQQRWGIGTLDQQLDMIDTNFRSAVASLEGPNEYDIQDDDNWVPILRTYQQRLWEGANSRPGLAALPIVGPSFASGDGPEEAGDLSAWTDEGNLHPYPGGEQPDRNSHLEAELRSATYNTGSQRVQATETGYHNAVANTTTSHRPVSERAAGTYVPRLFLDYFRRGIRRTFAYELVDTGDDPVASGDHFGLLRNDFSEKPAFTATKRLIALLEDRGPAFTPDNLSYSLQGAPSSARQLLLQKRDGSFYLVLWNQANAWNDESLVDLDPPDPKVTVQLGQSIARADVYRPNVSGAPVSTLVDPGAGLSLSLSEQVTVIKLVPGEGGSGPVYAPAPDPVSDPAPGGPSPAPSPRPAPAPGTAASPRPSADGPAAVSSPTAPAAKKNKRRDGRRRAHRPRRSSRRALLIAVQPATRAG